MECLFCNYDKKAYIAENELAFAIYDHFPVNKGHVLIIPKRHFENFFDAKEEEVCAIYDLMHLHVHLIPRYKGDVENPRGGIRKFKKNLVVYDG